MDLIPLGFLASLAAGTATGVGAIPVLFTRRAPERVMDTMLGFAAGVMLAATAFSLLVPALEIGGVWVAVVGLAIGAVFLELTIRLVTHMCFPPVRKALLRVSARYGCSYWQSLLPTSRKESLSESHSGLAITGAGSLSPSLSGFRTCRMIGRYPSAGARGLFSEACPVLCDPYRAR